MSITPNLWPKFEEKAIVTPLSILRDQGSYLNRLTKNIITAKIESETGSFKDVHSNEAYFMHVFCLVAPFVGNYRYQLFKVVHNIDLFPLAIYFEDRELKCQTQDEFLKVLGEILNSPRTQKVLSNLYAQSRPPAPRKERSVAISK